MHHKLHITALALALSAAYPAFAADEEEQITKVEVKGQNGKDDSYSAGSAHTATRMEMSIRDTPQSVSVVTRAFMDDLGLTRIDEALGLTTGVMIGQADTERTNFYARGFSINNFQIDGMPQGSNSPLSDTILYDRIEVVRGASGLMGGTGDPSAAVNMVRKRPGKTLTGSASVAFRRWDDRRVEVDLTVPLTSDGSVRSRVAVAHQDRDSYMDMYHERKTVGMAIVEADLTPGTLLTAGIDFQRNTPTGATWGAVPYWNFDGTVANLPRNFTLTTPWSTWANKQHTAFASVDQRFGNGWKLHLGYARTDSRNNTTVANGGAGYPNPTTGTGMRLWSGVWGEGKGINDNYDLYLTGPFTLLGRQHTLIAGWNGGKVVNSSQGGTANVLYPAAIPDYRNWTGNIPKPTFTPDGSHTETEVKLGGAYVAGRFSLSEPLTVVLGSRISNYRTEDSAFDTSGKFTGNSNLQKTSDEITPYVGFVYDLNQQMSAYASYTTLFNPQTAKDKNNRLLEPETGTNSELGIKGEFFDKKLNASAAVFRTLKKNLAVLDRTVPPGFELPGGAQAYVADGKGLTAKGIEFDVSGKISPNWNVSGGYTYLHVATAEGERGEPNQPRHLLRLTSSYKLDSVAPGLKVGGSLQMQSSTWSESWYGRPTAPAGEISKIAQGGYSLLGVFAGYEINRNLRAQLNISNLTDKKYYRNIGFYDGVFWGEPRNVSLTLTARF
ncbi:MULTISPECIES: TonB-dependent siderophore receptor [unclassified Duganella]|uniref:TonB-dependent siderophore receptor n=1 Tax=unclassified Duganella TaxID=2636909 RepID=UPI000889F626|nr:MULTISPECIES: TonB-dependent siderophore receptor [unclassified Duganella]SDG88795.1 outer-membrane receptor for ferric coprogen and ferric-rhodotorulic acid [Duganella sp. OV458]SDJ53306.1 outer-membrane receptor for ferric coprogen and ferric-rhodotorulic acid [Duganella sp. OV510]